MNPASASLHLKDPLNNEAIHLFSGHYSLIDPCPIIEPVSFATQGNTYSMRYLIDQIF